MRKFFLNPFLFLLLTGFSFFVFYACSDQKLAPSQDTTLADPAIASSSNNTNTTVAPVFNKNVGRPIDGNVGRGWINNFKKANSNIAESYVIQSTIIKKIITNIAVNW